MRYTDQLRDLAQLIEDESLPVPLTVTSFGTDRVVTELQLRTEDRDPWLELCTTTRETEVNADTWFVTGQLLYGDSSQHHAEVKATWSAPPCVDPACPHHAKETTT